jgi:hypothetical protein
MARNCDARDEIVTVVDLAERWILTETGARRLVQSARVPTVGLRSPGFGGDWDDIRFRLDAIRRWEADHQIVFFTTSECAVGTK